MTDDRDVRALLSRAAELPDTIQPPVTHLVETARRTRRQHILGSVLAVVAITGALFALPPALRALPPSGFSGAIGVVGAPGPTASQLAHFRWSVMPRSPLGSRSNPILAWTGSKLIELGGSRDGVVKQDGAIFDPALKRWRRITQPPKSIRLNNAVSVWTGSGSHQLFVTSNATPSYWIAGIGAPAGLYDPATNRWTVTDLPRQLLDLQLATPIWTGREVVLAGTSGSPARPRLEVAAYDIATRSWRMITPRLPRRHLTGAVAIVAASHKVILWSLWARSVRTKDGGTIYSGVDVLVLRHGRWTTMTGHWPQHRVIEGATFANSRILIPPGQFWCGPCPAPFSQSPAMLADADSLALTAVPNSPLVTQPLIQPPIWLWNGRAVLAADASGSSKSAPNGRLGALAAYDPLSRRWRTLPSAPDRPALAAPPMFAAQRLLVLTQNGGLLSLQKRS